MARRCDERPCSVYLPRKRVFPTLVRRRHAINVCALVAGSHGVHGCAICLNVCGASIDGLVSCQIFAFVRAHPRTPTHLSTVATYSRRLEQGTHSLFCTVCVPCADRHPAHANALSVAIGGCLVAVCARGTRWLLDTACQRPRIALVLHAPRRAPLRP